MNQPVRTVMNERAERLGAPDVDVASIMNTGARRQRRRRTAVAGAVGTLGALAVVGAGVLPGMLGTDTNRTTATEPGFAASFADREPTYAVGTNVHVDGLEFTVPTPVLAMVQTSAGIVYSDADGTVWSATGDTPAVEVGTTDPKRPRLAADGGRATWLDTSDAGTGTAFLVLDQASGLPDSVPVSLADSVRPKAVALDGDDLYAYDARGLVRVDLPTKDVTVVSPTSDELNLVDVEQGQIAHLVASQEEGAPMVGFVSHLIGEGNSPDAWTMLDLSDDGTHLLGETKPDTFAVFDIEAGTHEVITSPDHSFLLGYRWLDADTYLALGMNKPYDSTPVDLLRCEIGGDCTVAAPAIGSAEDGMVLPIGTSMDG